MDFFTKFLLVASVILSAVNAGPQNCDVIGILSSDVNGGLTNFNNVKNFFSDQVIPQVNTGGILGGNKIAALESGASSIPNYFDFGTYSTAQQQSAAVQLWQYVAGQNGPAKALEQAYVFLYGRPNHARPSSIILFADQKFNIGADPISISNTIRNIFNTQIIVVAYNGQTSVSDADQTSWLGITGGNANNIVFVPDSTHLTSYLTKIMSLICTTSGPTTTTPYVPPTTTMPPTTTTVPWWTTTAMPQTTPTVGTSSNVVLMVDTSFTLGGAQQNAWSSIKSSFVDVVNYQRVRVSLGYSSGNGTTGQQATKLLVHLAGGYSMSTLDNVITDAITNQRYFTQWSGTSDLYDALRVSWTELQSNARPGGRKYIILATDGAINAADQSKTENIASQIRNAGIEIMAYVIGNNPQYINLGVITGSAENVSGNINTFLARINSSTD